MRAILLASATATSLKGFFSISFFAHIRNGSLEDVACLVFLRYYAENFAAKHAREKVFDILLKTQRKMSPRGRAVGLDFGFPAPILALYKQGLRVLETARTPRTAMVS